MTTIPAPDTILASILGERAAEASEVEWLSKPQAAKNQIVRYRVGDELRVLKVFSHGWRYSLSLVKTPMSLWARNFKLRRSAAQRVRAERDADAAFRAAGLSSFEILDRPAANALVFRHYAGQSVRRLMAERDDPAFTRELLGTVAEDFARRQQLALERNDPRLVHPDPCVKHVWVTPEGERLLFDFEGCVNLALPLDELLAREAEVFVFQVGRTGGTDAAGMQAFVERLGPAVRERWRTQSAQPHWGRSKSNRRRTPEVQALMG